MTLYIRFKRTARLSLMAMTTCNAIDTIFFFLAFIVSLCVPAMACCITYIWIMTFPSAKCVALPSNPIKMYYLLFSEGVGILEGPKLLSAACGMCSEYQYREEASV